MENITKGLIGLAALAFLLTVILSLTNQNLIASAQGFSRACNNLALVAIALMLMGKKSIT
jgi:hypothetical protein